METAKRTGEKRGVVGYLRVSTEEQADSSAGLGVQEAAIRAECQLRELALLAMHTDVGVSDKSRVRPALTAALEELDAHRGDVLMVAKLDRLTRSVMTPAGLCNGRRSRVGDWWRLMRLWTPRHPLAGPWRR